MQPKELVVLLGGPHIDLFNRPVYVDLTVDRHTTFYGRYLDSALAVGED